MISIFGSGLGLVFDQIFRIGYIRIANCRFSRGENQFSNSCSGCTIKYNNLILNHISDLILFQIYSHLCVQCLKLTVRCHCYLFLSASHLFFLELRKSYICSSCKTQLFSQNSQISYLFPLIWISLVPCWILLHLTYLIVDPDPKHKLT